MRDLGRMHIDIAAPGLSVPGYDSSRDIASRRYV